MLDRLRVCFFWLFATGIVGGLWMYADARSAMARTPATLPPQWPTSRPARYFPWPADGSAEKSVSAPDIGETESAD